MSYFLFDIELLQKEIDEYCHTLDTFIRKFNLSHLIVDNPIDHFALKLTDSDHYQFFIDSLREHSHAMSFTPMNNRRIAFALLKEPLVFSLLKTENNCRVMEIIEPKPEKKGQTLVGFDHIEVYHQSLADIKEFLTIHEISYEDYENPNHKAVVIPINEKGQEIKFTDSRLEEIVQQQIADGSSVVIK
jgi:predicted metalloenzyme YecM